MTVKKEIQNTKGKLCMCCKGKECNCIKWIFLLKALIMLVFGFMLLKGYLTLTQVASYLLLLLGIKYLFIGFKCR